MSRNFLLLNDWNERGSGRSFSLLVLCWRIESILKFRFSTLPYPSLHSKDAKVKTAPASADGFQHQPQ
jgi:hypothetical protein